MTEPILSESNPINQESKKCTKCFIVKPLSEFYIRNDRKSGHWPHCKKCQYAKAVKYRTSEKQKKSYAKWYSLRTNKAKVKDYGAQYRKSIAKYETYKNKLIGIDDIEQDENGFLIGRCAYCGKKMSLTNEQAKHRCSAIKGIATGDGRYYCSEECKTACPVFQQHKTYKGYKDVHTREVPAEFRQIILKERNYTCEKCGSTKNGLHVHHIDGYTEMPMFAADKKNVLVLCFDCHKTVHQQKGCSYYDYRCN